MINKSHARFIKQWDFLENSAETKVSVFKIYKMKNKNDKKNLTLGTNYLGYQLIGY